MFAFTSNQYTCKFKSVLFCFLTGRLTFSTVDGRNPQDTSKFDRLYFYGGRSVSIFRADDFSLVYDSGDDVERKHAIFFPDIFNADYTSDDPDTETIEDTFDKRSDNKVNAISIILKKFYFLLFWKDQWILWITHSYILTKNIN